MVSGPPGSPWTDTAFYAYRGKGGKRGRRELSRPAYEAITRTLADCGTELAAMAPEESPWQAGAGQRGITSGAFYARFRRYLAAAGLAPTGVHVLRHTAAKLRRDAGESIESISAFLDHSSVAVTTVYLRRLEGQEDHAWERSLRQSGWRSSGERGWRSSGERGWRQRIPGRLPE